MSSEGWDAASLKAQLRLTSQRLGQLQERLDSQGSITRRDIATLLQQGNSALARAKTQRLMDDDIMGDLLEVLEMHVGLIIEHFHELANNASLSPIIIEAASSIIYAAPFVDCKDLHIARDLLSQRLGSDFAQSAAGNHDRYVPIRVLNAISPPPPSATIIDAYLTNIAHTFSIKWTPEPRREEIVSVLSEILDPASSPLVDLPRLRKLCARGIPDEPGFLRPRLWKIFFGVLPVLKSSWSATMKKHRDSYYELVTRLLEPLSSLPSPTVPLSQQDLSLLNVASQLSRIQPSLFINLEHEPPASSGLSPLDSSSPFPSRISCANILDARLRSIRRDDDLPQPVPSSVPEIRLDSGNETVATPLVLSKSRGSVSQKHLSALLRLLYLHSSINPGNLSPHLPSLLVPLYSVLYQEMDTEELVHVEADTFWLFEAVVGEFVELEDEEGGSLWMKKLGERLTWADPDLKENLHSKGLDPGLPHYSYRWLAPILTQTLPLSSVTIAWDAIFSCPMSDRDSNPKLDFLVDICTAMLIRARAVLLRLGKDGQRSPSLWAEESMTLPPPSPVRAWELGDAFLEGMSLLQSYPIETAGGIDRVLQTASDLAHRRVEEARSSKDQKLGIAAKLKVTMWKGFTNQAASPQLSPVASDESDEENSDSEHDGNKTETSGGFGSRLATTFWRGITNQSSMENPPSPVTPMSPELPLSPEASLSPRSLSQGIWSYAEKLKDSDAAATLSKVSSNWKAKAIGKWSSSSSPSDGSSLALPEPREDQIRNSAPVFKDYQWNDSGDDRRVSLPGIDRSGVYSPPARPAYFRQPRDTVVFTGNSRPNLDHIASEHGGGFMSKTKSLQVSLASLTRSQTPQPTRKTGPRPLLLSSSNLMSQDSHISRSTSNTPLRERQSDGMRPRGHGLQDSISSISSMGSDTLSGRIRTRHNDRGPDSSVSRRVPINRRSVLNVSPNSRIPSTIRHVSESSSGASDSGVQSPAVLSEGGNQQGWTRVDAVESPPLSSPPPTPVTTSTLSDNSVKVNESEPVRGSLVLADPAISPTEPSSHMRKVIRKKTPPPRYHGSDTSDSSAISPMPRTPRVRSKRHPNRPTNLHLHDVPRKESAESLAVEWPEDPEPLLTPKASEFEPDTDFPLRRRKSSTDEVARPRQLSSEGDTRTRKVSTGSRMRKISTETKEAVKRIREMAAEEGAADDEGYDDLLSAYESEDSRIDLGY